jgi:hypothetical protein
MLVLINCSYDGDSYRIFENHENANEAFLESCESGSYHRVYLVEPDYPESTFGFGSYGDVFGANIVEFFVSEEE